MSNKQPTTFAELVRQPTGRHFLDSGDAYGRHWQQPAEPAKLFIDIRIKALTCFDGTVRRDIDASINTAVFLDNLLEIDAELTAKVREAGLHWSQECAEFLKENATDLDLPEFEHEQTNNSYNGESDLSQVIQYTVLSERDEWYYDDNAIVCIQTHNGCDVRGGYSDALVCRFKGENAALALLSPVIGWGFEKGTDKNGNELDREELERLDEHFRPGYSSCPTYHLNERIVGCVDSKEGDESITITLDTGETVTAWPCCEAEWI